MLVIARPVIELATPQDGQRLSKIIPCRMLSWVLLCLNVFAFNPLYLLILIHFINQNGSYRNETHRMSFKDFSLMVSSILYRDGVILGDSGGGYGQSQTQCSQCKYSFISLSYFLSFPVVNRFDFFLLPLITTSYFIYKTFSTTTLWGRTLWFLESTLHTLLVKHGGQVKFVCSYH